MFDGFLGGFGRNVGMAHLAVFYRAFQRFDAGIEMSFGFAFGNFGAFFGMRQSGFGVFYQYRGMAGFAVGDGLIGVFQCGCGVFFCNGAGSG